jgi:hypothetical protein
LKLYGICGHVVFLLTFGFGDTTVAECVEDANEEGFSREDLDQAAGGDLKAYVREAIAKAQGR